MKTTIFYMSGTGNTKYIATEIGKKLEQTEYINIGSLKENQTVAINSERIGFLFPCYCQDVPNPVREVMKRLKVIVKPSYAFVICTHNGEVGGALLTAEKLLEKKGIDVQYLSDIIMPGNSIIVKDYTNPKEVRDRRLKEAEQQVKTYGEEIKNLKRNITSYHFPLKYRLKGLYSNLGLFKVYKIHTKYFVDENCNGCGSCKKVCSFSNISMINDKPTWGVNCEACLGCLHYCPKKAIQMDQNSKNSLRYHHPKIGLNNIMTR